MLAYLIFAKKSLFFTAIKSKFLRRFRPHRTDISRNEPLGAPVLSQNLFCHPNKARNSYCQRLKINTVSHRLRAEKVVKLLSRPKRQEQDIIVPWENLAMNVTQKPHYSLAVCQCSHKKLHKKIKAKTNGNSCKRASSIFFRASFPSFLAIYIFLLCGEEQSRDIEGVA